MIANFSGLTFDAFNQIEAPTLILANPDKTEIASLADAFDVTISLNFLSLSELRFKLPSLSPYYELVNGLKLIKIDPFGWFRIENPNTVSDGIREVKECKAYSLEIEFAYKKINALTGTFKFYDPLNMDGTIIGIVLEKLPSWGVGVIDPSLNAKYRTFDINDKSAYEFLMQDVQDDFQCVVTFDTYTKKINATAVENVTANSIGYLSFDNLLKEVSVEELCDEMVTRVEVYGASDVDIRAVNPRGDNYLYNLDYYMTTEWLPQNIVTKWEEYKHDFNTSQETYRQLTAMWRVQNASLLTQQNRLIDLNNELTVLENLQVVKIQNNQATSSNPDWVELVAQVNAKKVEITNQQVLISSTQDSVDSILQQLQAIVESLQFGNYFTEEEWITLDSYIQDGTIQNDTFVYVDTSLSDIPDLNSTITSGILNISNSTIATAYDNVSNRIDDITGGNFVFTWGEYTLTGTIRYGNISTYSANDNYIFTASIVDCLINDTISFNVGQLSISGTKTSLTTTDSSLNLQAGASTFFLSEELSENDKLTVSQELYNYASDVFIRLAQPSYQFSIDSINFLFLKEYIDITRTVELGSTLAIELKEDNVIYPVLLQIDLSFEDETSFSMTFGNKFRLRNNEFILADLLEQSITGGTNVSFGRANYSDYTKSGNKTSVMTFISGALNTAKNRLISNDQQNILIDSNGIRARQFNSEIGTFNPNQIWIVNDMIAFSNDSFNTAKMAIGRFEDVNLGETWGIVAPSIVGTLLAGETLIIEGLNPDDQTVTFRVDGNGAYLYNASMIIEKDNSRIILDPSDKFRIQKKINVSTWEDKFYVDNAGNLHFAGTLTGADGNFSGNITAATITGSTITGGTINIGSNFSVSSNGTVTATNGNFSGTINGGLVIGAAISGGSISGTTIQASELQGGRWYSSLRYSYFEFGALGSDIQNDWTFYVHNNNSGSTQFLIREVSHHGSIVFRTNIVSYFVRNNSGSDTLKIQYSQNGSSHLTGGKWNYDGYEIINTSTVNGYAQSAALTTLSSAMYPGYSASNIVNLSLLSTYINTNAFSGPYATQNWVDLYFVRK